MGVFDAITAQELATRHRRSVAVVQDGLRTVNALLAKIIDGGKIKWGGYGTNFEWYVRKASTTPQWISGQLGTRTFEEQDTVAKATLPYCFIEQTYGIGERSIKTNRAAGDNKIYDIQKENARVAQTGLYSAFSAALFSDGSNSLQPVGLAGMVGNVYSASGTNASDYPIVAAGKTYAGITLNTAAVPTTQSTAGWSSVYSTMGWDCWYWYPFVAMGAALYATTPAWSGSAVRQLAQMEAYMTYSSDISGTGGILRPDMAIMDNDPYNVLVGILATSQYTYNVPLGTKDPSLADFTTIRVGGLDCVRDTNTPACANSRERIFVLDSKQFWLDSLNSKSEGLVEGEMEANDPNVRGLVGVYKANFGIGITTPKAIGCIVGCDD